MTALPDNFTFKYYQDGRTFSAYRYMSEWNISWENDHGVELSYPCSISAVEEFVKTGMWTIQEEFTDVSQMTLPEKFRFTCQNLPTVYKAKLIGRNYHINWYENGECSGGVQYTTEMVKEYFVKGEWTIYLDNPSKIVRKSKALNSLINEKTDASELEYEELEALRLVRGLINRLLCDS